MGGGIVRGAHRTLDPTTLRVFLRACRFSSASRWSHETTRGRDARRGISSARKADGGTSRMGMSPVRDTRQIGVLTLTHWFRITVVVLRIRTEQPSSRQDRFPVVRFTNDPFVLTPEPDVGSSLEVCRASVQRRNAAMNAEIYRYPLALPLRPSRVRLSVYTATTVGNHVV